MPRPLARIFAYDGRADRIVPADADAKDDAKDDQPPDVGREGRDDGADREHQHLIAVDSLAG